MKKEEKVIVIIFGRKEGFGIPESDLIKLPKSYLSFFGNRFSEIHPDRVYENLALYFVEDYSDIGVQNPIYEVGKSDAPKIYFIELFTYANSFRAETLTCILQTLIKEEKYNPDVDQLYYLCHGSDFGKSGFIEGPIEDQEKKKIIKSINEYPICQKIKHENVFIATFYHEPASRIFSAIKEKIVPKQLNTLNINEVYKSFDKEKLEDTKKKIINTFLPLILDIKGFNELPDDSKRRKEYLKEIYQAIGKQKPEPITNSEKKATSAENEDTLYGYGIDLISDWNEIKKVLAIKVDKNSMVEEALSEKYRITDKASLYFSPLESEKKPGFTVDNIKELFSDSKKDDREKAIQWFNNIQKLLDEKIKPERESGTSKW